MSTLSNTESVLAPKVKYGVDYKLFGEIELERTLFRDSSEKISKKSVDCGVELYIEVDKAFTKILLIIENPNQSEGVIVGTLEIPFPEIDKPGKIIAIPGVIDIRLFKCNGAPPPLSSSPAAALPLKLEYGRDQPSMADKIKISNIYGRPTVSDEFIPVVKGKTNPGLKSPVNFTLNPLLGDALKMVITNNKQKIIERDCAQWNGTSNCIAEAARNSSVEPFICGRCKRFLAEKPEFKCSNTSCTNAVYIDAKGNVKNHMCNSCCSSNN